MSDVRRIRINGAYVIRSAESRPRKLPVVRGHVRTPVRGSDLALALAVKARMTR